jgi:autoinducer 2-degrading protein
MYVVCVTVSVLPENIDQFIRATLENAAATRAEPGCARFDVLRAVEEPSRFFLYEAYRAESDFAAHQKTAHYLAWREKVAPMMASPRAGVKHVSLSPDPWV